MRHFFSKAVMGLCVGSFFIGTFIMSAQLNLPRGSQMAKVSQRVGITDITIVYSRPKVNNREIWGKLVPYGMNNLGFGTAKESPWRAGANENTTITFSHDVTLGGKKVKAGTYGLHLLVHDSEKATLILSEDAKSWGSYFYNPEQDVARVAIKTKAIPHKEMLTFEFTDVTPTTATAALEWEKMAFPFTVEVPVTNIVLQDIRAKLKDSPGFTRQNWEQAAQYSLANGGDLDEALAWVDAAIAGQFFSQKTFANLQLKAQIMNAMNKPEAAEAIMTEAVDIATVFEAHQYGRQLIASGKKEKAMQVFKDNANKYKNTWPVDYGLARGYSAKGDYKKALKHLKIAHKRAPDKLNQDAIVANLAKLEKGIDIN